MLVEALLYVLTPAPSWVRRNGFLRESIAIGARHGRQAAAWDEHLQNSRRMVLEAADSCPGRSHAVVFGSGHGFDVPLRELSRLFSTVSLVDAVHPLSMRWRAGRLPNVTLITADVTGRFGPPWSIEPAADLVVSLNLISQLGIATGEGQADRQALRQAHLRQLADSGATLCVIGDTERQVLSADGVVVERIGVDWSDDLTASRSEEWTWRLAPLGELSKKTEAVSTVRAVIKPPV